MGNEGSLPQGTNNNNNNNNAAAGDEELEHQARAPPSSSNPPLPSSSSSQQQQQQQQRTAGGRMINAVFHRRNQNNNNKTDNDYDISLNGNGEDMATMMMSPEQQQQQQQHYYQQEQQQQPMHQMQQQQQTMPNQHYPQHASSTTQQQQQENGEPVDGVLYQNSPNANTSTSKKGLNFRPSGRGAAAIINSMRNLSLGNAMNRTSASSPKHATTTTGKEVNDWETKWDEDDDSDDDDEKPNGVPMTTTTTMPLHPQMRPGMDAGLSSATPTTVIPIMAATTATTLEAKSATTTTTDAPQQSQPHVVPAAAEDGVEWDTGAVLHQGPVVPNDKPNVQMFMPLLRVLGKGSFGKVRTTCVVCIVFISKGLISIAMYVCMNVCMLLSFDFLNQSIDYYLCDRSFWYKSGKERSEAHSLQ
jgi:hypothetical protein